MALPPIISNLPIIKFFTSGSSGAKAQAASAKTTAPTDVVEISEAAQKKLEQASGEAITTESAARDIAGDTRIILDSNEDSTLGLDPQFVRDNSS
jgi:hypothetical protein